MHLETATKNTKNCAIKVGEFPDEAGFSGLPFFAASASRAVT
jgi:hypothetical protein